VSLIHMSPIHIYYVLMFFSFLSYPAHIDYFFILFFSPAPRPVGLFLWYGLTPFFF